MYSYTYLEKYKHFTYFLNKVITTNICLPWVLVTLTYFDYLVQALLISFPQILKFLLFLIFRARRDRDRMVVGYTTTHAISAYDY